MITIESVMLVTLGFLFAALLGLVLAPLYRGRIARLTTQNLKRSMPLTEAEIRADKDRLRADYAILIHRLGQQVEEGSLAAARQRIELNRRDAAISALEGEVSTVRTSLEEHENARRVLEHTIMDRLPKVEFRLAEARKLLYQRDREIATLTQSAEKQSRALDEATQINTQQRDEIHRLGAALTTRAARSREGLGDPSFDGEVALRTEVEALRAKSRDQASVITRLQGLLGRAGGAAGAAVDQHDAGSGKGDGASTPLSVHRADEEITRLRHDLAEAEAALRSVKSSAAAGQAGREALQTELRTLKSSKQDQAAELAQLRAALNSYQEAEKSSQAMADSKMAIKARLASAQAQAIEQAGTIQSLRAELAAANERMARQAAHFMDEMRRLGAGQRGAGVMANNVSEASSRRALTDRIADPRTASNFDAAPAKSYNATPSPPEQSPSPSSPVQQSANKTAAKASSAKSKRKPAFLRALEGAKASVIQATTTAPEKVTQPSQSSKDDGSKDIASHDIAETKPVVSAPPPAIPASAAPAPKHEPAKPAEVSANAEPKQTSKAPPRKNKRTRKRAAAPTAKKTTVAQRITQAAAPAEPEKPKAVNDESATVADNAKADTKRGRFTERIVSAAEGQASHKSATAKEVSEQDQATKPSAGRKPGLLDRITSLDKPKEPSRSA